MKAPRDSTSALQCEAFYRILTWFVAPGYSDLAGRLPAILLRLLAATVSSQDWLGAPRHYLRRLGPVRALPGADFAGFPAGAGRSVSAHTNRYRARESVKKPKGQDTGACYAPHYAGKQPCREAPITYTLGRAIESIKAAASRWLSSHAPAAAWNGRDRNPASRLHSDVRIRSAQMTWKTTCVGVRQVATTMQPAASARPESIRSCVSANASRKSGARSSATAGSQGRIARCTAWRRAIKALIEKRSLCDVRIVGGGARCVANARRSLVSRPIGFLGTPALGRTGH
jgi:hypothetical protein